jgi:RNA polymerase sigma factor (sigma-70 family)
VLPASIVADCNTDRLGCLFEVHHERLYGLARRLSNSPEDAQDLLQDTFVRAARHLHSIPISAPREEAWLVRVLVNAARDRWRRKAVERRARYAMADDTTVSLGGESSAVARLTIWQALNGLPPRRRAIVVLCELEDQSVVTVAQTLGLSAVTVRWHLAQARRQLAKIIGPE